MNLYLFVFFLASSAKQLSADYKSIYTRCFDATHGMMLIGLMFLVRLHYICVHLDYFS